MKKNHTVSLCVFFLLLLGAVSVNADDLMDKAKGLFKPLPAKAPDPENNTVTPEKVALGKMLFFEPRLSRSGLISCNSCHNLGMGGMTINQHPLVTVGRKARVMRQPF